MESLPMLGGTYITQGGDVVKMVKIHNIGTPYECLEDETGINRYSRRLDDMGRVTGSAHDYSHSSNLKRPILAIRLELLRRRKPKETHCQG